MTDHFPTDITLSIKLNISLDDIAAMLASHDGPATAAVKLLSSPTPETLAALMVEYIEGAIENRTEYTGDEHDVERYYPAASTFLSLSAAEVERRNDSL